MILPPFSSINLFATGNFPKHSTEGFPCKVFRNCETKQFWQKIVIPAPSLIASIFRYQKFSETQKGSSAKFFGTVRQKFFNGKSWYPFSWSTEISGRFDVCKNSLKTNSKTVVLFLTVCKSWSKYLYLGEKHAGASRPSCYSIVQILLLSFFFEFWQPILHTSVLLHKMERHWYQKF